MGYEYFEAFCKRHHSELVVMNGEDLSPEQELVRDLMALVTGFSARLHGLRSYRKVLKDAALQKEKDMNRSHVIRLNPTPEQEVYFRKACGVARHAYNWALALSAERAKLSALKQVRRCRKYVLLHFRKQVES